MKMVRFRLNEKAHLGVCLGEEVIDISEINGKRFQSILDLLIEAKEEGKRLEEKLEELLNKNLPTYPLKSLKLLKPIEPPEIWGAGVTYKRSEEEREKETGIKGIYNMVYRAKRPEIFFKATNHRCVGPDEEVGIRGDSNWTVPEPELAFLIGFDKEIVGFTIGNDISARDIEGANPLYLPQAKIFEACCAIGPSIVTVDEVGIEPKLKIECRIYRNEELIFHGETSTENMKRSINEIKEYLCRYNPIPPGTLCLTGTGIVPPEDFALMEGDLIEITIENIGTLRNKAKLLKY
ncbi:MAG: fumarylacetoacetate hydrolase family protein [Synergistetes bacterium]|nr:fumarylacetoacetate hydrolase family protein [Synergistota bacterium]MDK2871807.1 2-dehydro-3-deoxy-D-arabinonate dehydratase [bacterium]